MGNRGFFMYQLIELILLVMLSVYIFLRLRSVLGQTGDSESDFDRSHRNHRDENDRVIDIHEDLSDKVVPLHKNNSDFLKEVLIAQNNQELPYLNHNPAQINPVVDFICEKIPDFSLSYFVSGARHAFDLIVNSYSAGDLNKIKKLISSKVLKSFTQAIKEREKNKETLSIEVVKHIQTTIMNAQRNENVVFFDVQFKTEQIIYTTNENGIIYDNPAKLTTVMADVWRFSKDVSKKDPTWILDSIVQSEQIHE